MTKGTLQRATIIKHHGTAETFASAELVLASLGGTIRAAHRITIRNFELDALYWLTAAGASLDTITAVKAPATSPARTARGVWKR